MSLKRSCEESKVEIRRLNDVSIIKDLWPKFFTEDEWNGKDSTVYWAAYEGDTILGFCAVNSLDDAGFLFFSSAAVLKEARGKGIQRRFIQVREKYARSVGATHAVTYTVKDNYASIANLIKSGFRFYAPEWMCAEPDYFHYIKKL